MTILEVQNLKKTYTTRFGGAQVEALKTLLFQWRRESTSRSWENPDQVKRHF